MRTKFRATSGPVFSLYLSIVLLVVLISVSDKAHAKQSDAREERSSGQIRTNNYVRKGGCASFGHSCFGGHGKRFDSSIQHNTLQESIGQNQESEVPSPNDELFYILPNDEFRERSDKLPFIRTRKDTQQFDLYPLSSFVNQWIASHRRPHRIDTDITNK